MNCSFTGAYMRNYYAARIDWVRGIGDGAPRDFHSTVFGAKVAEKSFCFNVEDVRTRLYGSLARRFGYTHCERAAVDQREAFPAIVSPCDFVFNP